MSNVKKYTLFVMMVVLVILLHNDEDDLYSERLLTGGE